MSKIKVGSKIAVVLGVSALACAATLKFESQAKTQAQLPSTQTPVSSANIAQGKALMQAQKYGDALKYFSKQIEAKPNDSECHYLMGKSFIKTKDLAHARKHFRMAIRYGKGSQFAKKANDELLAMGGDHVKPRMGFDTRMLASLFGFARERGAGEAAKPTVINFYAAWAAPCKKLDDVMVKYKQEHGKALNFMKVDVDDPKNDQIVDQYEVSPVPTVVFLNDEGEVVSYSVGFSGETSVQNGIKKILKDAK
ncbi:MAG: hypothetical protein IPG59_05350 [Candidatus Melainabacteria bacterium]|nr:MAG: hypothetical protein IPG59_05350 [Candidatus Melainabacteria bacterium]